MEGDPNAIEIVEVKAWKFVQHQVAAVYPSFYSMHWECKMMLMAHYLAADNFNQLRCCYSDICHCKRHEEEYGVPLGWKCCLCLQHTCRIVHNNWYFRTDIVAVVMKRDDLKM